MINIDLINTVLLLFAGVLAYFFPLELFIFSFAILGPLHYLTEINWLDSKNYFTPGKKSIWLSIAVIASLIIVGPRLCLIYFQDESTFIHQFLSTIRQWSNSATFVALIISIGFLLKKSRTTWYLLVPLALIVGILLNQVGTYLIIVGILVPTVIHVYLFTLFFMLYGAIKAKQKLGYFNVLIAIIIPIVYVFLDLEGKNYLFSDELKAIYLDNNLHYTPVFLAKFMGLSDGKTFFFYEQLELKLMMFLSFIYLYHYLNWFSKTTTISWHKTLNKRKTILIILLWLVMLLLFYIDFKMGFLAALFFSFLHVVLEFPLNMISIKSSFSELLRLSKNGKK